MKIIELMFNWFVCNSNYTNINNDDDDYKLGAINDNLWIPTVCYNMSVWGNLWQVIMDFGFKTYSSPTLTKRPFEEASQTYKMVLKAHRNQFSHLKRNINCYESLIKKIKDSCDICQWVSFSFLFLYLTASIVTFYLTVFQQEEQNEKIYTETEDCKALTEALTDVYATLDKCMVPL